MMYNINDKFVMSSGIELTLVGTREEYGNLIYELSATMTTDGYKIETVCSEFAFMQRIKDGSITQVVQQQPYKLNEELFTL